MKEIKIIAFDADDTLWVNEPYFQETEHKFCALLKDYLPHQKVAQELFNTEMNNLRLYGYGAKGFILSMIETILKITENKADSTLVNQTIELGKQLLNKPIELLNDVEDVLKKLNSGYRLVMATKGDLLDQERKLLNSGLEKYFHHIEIMSNKEKKDYLKLLERLNCAPQNFLMIGNSMKSDILPVLELGGYAIHIPYHTTWAHEQVTQKTVHKNFIQAKNMKEILNYLS